MFALAQALLAVWEYCDSHKLDAGISSYTTKVYPRKILAIITKGLE